MEKYFVLLGGNKLLRGQVHHLNELGYKVIVVAWNDNPDVQGDMFIQMDVKDAKGIIAKLEELCLKEQISGALSSIDLAAPTVNAINRWCGNKTMPDKFDKVLSKEEMRDCWMKAGVFNRISKMDNEFPLDEIYETSKKMKLICKPNVAASSRGITILEKGQPKETLTEALAKAKETSFDGRCLIEEFVEGEEFTVDMLGDAYGNVNCYSSSIQHHSLYALKNHVTVIHHWNSRKYDDVTWVRIANFGIECYKALGLHSMFGHLEIIMKEVGTFTPVEMGARSSGFICSHTVWKASGHDYLGDYVRMLHGEAIIPGNYMNGENGTIFDWIMNEKTSDFMCFYKDGSCGAAKLRVNKDSSLKMYLYEYGQKSPFLEKDIKEKFRKEYVYELAIILNLVMDENGIFDRAINDYNFNVVIDNKKRQEFDNLCNERIR